jgi:DNA-directed RNA polymerase specialized sigma24 family protein
MSAEGSVSQWLDRLREGDPEAAQRLWERYFLRLAGLARMRLQGSPRRAANEEDVALSALASFFRGIERDRFPQVRDRNDLWRLLMVITARKTCHLLRREKQQKRGGGLPGEGLASEEMLLDDLVSREPTPAFAAEMAEQCRLLLELLDDRQLQIVALARMEGYTNDEIARQLDCAPRTVERKLRLIRSLWESERPS